MSRRLMIGAALLTVMSASAGASAAAAQAYQGPTAVTVSKDGKHLYVANTDAGTVAFIAAAGREAIRTITMPSPPMGFALSPDGATLYVGCAGTPSTVQVLDAASGEFRGVVKVGHTATALAIGNDGKRLYVCNRFDDDISEIDTAELREVGRVRVMREPVAIALTPDDGTLFVANHLPADAADGENVSAVVTAIDARTHAAVTIRLPNGSSGVRGLCISTDGGHVYVTHTIGRYHLPTVQVERGWISTNAMSIIDAKTKTLVSTVLLDEVDRGAANPWGVATTADGKYICVAHAGTNEVSAIDAPAMLAKIAARSQGSGASQIAVCDDLTFLTGLRRRIAVKGIGPRGIAVSGKVAYVCEYFSDTVGVVSIESGSAGQIALGSPPEVTLQRRGEMLFNSGELCLQGWQSCATCHPDARADCLNWDLVNDGLGNPKNVRSMLLVHETPPSMASGVRPTAEEAVRAGITHIQFTSRPEADASAIDAYLRSLKPVPSPLVVNGQLSEAARRGERLFFDKKVGCGECHPAPVYTDLKPYDVRSKGKFDRNESFDTPTLIECWRTAPYMHDGHFVTIRELLETGRHGDTQGNLDDLTAGEMADLIEFVLSM